MMPDWHPWAIQDGRQNPIWPTKERVSIEFRIGDRELIMSTYPMSQNLQVAPRLLSGNGGA